MFQRFKLPNLDSFLDTKIAEEQAKQNANGQARNGSPARRSTSTAGARRGTPAARNASPGARAGKGKITDPLGVSGARGPDPEEFVIGDDGSDLSRAATPRLAAEPVGATVESAGEKTGKSETVAASEAKFVDDALPEDIRKKLAKLEMLTARYQDLLRNYRTAHARVAQIEPFESTLREHTPLTGIAEPGALVEFLNQRSLQSDMTTEELKRVTGEFRGMITERDDMKKKLEEAERKTKEAFDEAAGLRQEKESAGKLEASAARAEPVEGNTLLSQPSESEESKAEEKQYINELETENAQSRQDLSTCRLDLDAARYNLSRQSTEIDTLQNELALAKTEIQRAAEVQKEHDESLKTGKYAGRDGQRLKTYEELVKQLRAQVKETEDSKTQSLGRISDLEFQIKLLQAEAKSSETLLTRLRPQEERAVLLTKRLEEAEKSRDEALRMVDSKKGHEAAVASLRSQLKRVTEDRDAAYQMILDCGKCKVPEQEETTSKDDELTEARSRDVSDTTEPTEASPMPSGVSTPPVDADNAAGDPKRKKKKKSKSKAKKGTADNEDSADVEAHRAVAQRLANAINEHAARDDHNDDEVRAHLEARIEEQQQGLENARLVIQARDEEITGLKQEIESKEKTIARLEKGLKDQEGLQEEIDTLRNDLTDLADTATSAKRELTEEKSAHSHTSVNLAEARSKCTEWSQRCSKLEESAADEARKASNQELASGENTNALSEELTAARNELEMLAKLLQAAKDRHKKEVDDLQQKSLDDISKHDLEKTSLNTELEKLKSHATSHDSDLNAANLLAQNRYKELTDMKQTFARIQPELKRLREESAEMKAQKAELDKANSTVGKLEATERALKAELNEHKTQSVKRDAESADLNDKLKKARERASALEDTYERSRKDIEEHQRIRDEAVDAKEKLQQQLERSQQERRTLRAQVDDLDKQVKKATGESQSLRDEVQMKSAKHASAQSLMESLENQSRELAAQLKETQTRCDASEEELADSQRLLSERGREAETMRRLLADVEGRAESRIKEMRERLDLATEERDRAEDEASTLGRKKAREVEDYKHKLRDLERDVSRATDAKSDAERKETDLRARHDDVERRLTLAQNEASEVRAAMTQLRDALDEGERQARDSEKQKLELRKTLEERETRLEKLQKSSKAMAEELRTLQTINKRQPSVQSSRSSMEGRVSSPVKASNTNKPAETIDYVYLKNILLQFLEQKDKRTQLQLVPVLGMLLHFDKTEESKWMSVVSAK